MKRRVLSPSDCSGIKSQLLQPGDPVPAKRYSEYLRTPYWMALSLKMKELANWRCQACQIHANVNILHVHHRSYKRLWKERLSDLIVLCAACHENTHAFIKNRDTRIKRRTNKQIERYTSFKKTEKLIKVSAIASPKRLRKMIHCESEPISCTPEIRF